MSDYYRSFGMLAPGDERRINLNEISLSYMDELTDER